MDTASGPVEANDAPSREHLFLYTGRLHHFHRRRRAQVERQEDDIHTVRGNVAQRAAAEVQPSAPRKRMVQSAVVGKLPLLFRAVDGMPLGPPALVRTRWSGAEPEVPIECGGYGILALRTVIALGPDRAVGSHVDFGDFANCAGLNELGRAQGAGLRAGLRTHLRDHLRLGGHTGHDSSFVYGLAERLLAVDVETVPHGVH